MAIADIIKKVEKATGGQDPALDYAILRHLAGGDDANVIYRPLTVAVDAVLSLIEEKMPGHRWLVRSDEERGAFANLVPFGCRYEGEGIDHFPVYAPAPALALLLAFLRAWEAKSNG